MKTLLARVTLVVTIALLPGLAVQIYTAHDAERTRDRLMDEEALRLVRLVSAIQQRIVDSSELVLDTIRVSPAVQDQDPEACRRLFASLVAATPRYSFAGLVGRDGHTICASGPIEPGVAATDRPYFTRALQSDELAIGDYTIGRGSGRPAIHFAKPLKDRTGAVTGVVVIALNLQWLQEQLQDLLLPAEVVAGVTDRNGVVLARVPYQAKYVGVPILAENRFILDGSTISLARGRNRDGHETLVGYSPLEAAPMGIAVFVALDKVTAFADLTARNRATLALISAAGVLAVILMFLFGRRLISRPVAQLLRAAERWQSGDLRARCGLRHTESEFGRLGAAFDEMAATLEARGRALQMALESTQDAVIVCDRAWRYTYMNANARALTGRDLVGQVLWEANPEMIGTPVAAALQKAMQTGKPVEAEQYADPLKRHLQINAYPSEEGITVFCRDLTEARRVEAALRDSEERLRLATETMQLGIRDINLSTNAGLWSPVAAGMLGMDNAADGLFGRWFSRIHPDDQARIRSAWEDAVATGRQDYTAQYRLRHADGAWHWIEAHTHFFFEDGRPVRAIGVVQDITGRRAMEDELRRLNVTLEARVQEEVAAREVAQRRAAQAERVQALGQLAGGIAHDFNNVLQAIIGAVTLLERRSEDSAAVRRFARLANEAAERGSSITRRMLGFARRGELRAEPVNIADLLGGLWEILNHTLGAGVSVEVAAADGLAPALTDRGQLETVLINLATNARDAMPTGGCIRLSAEPDFWPPRGAAEADRYAPVDLAAGDYVRLAITDTGVGMDAATLARAVEPFFTTKGLGDGTGLGLSMAKGFAEQSGGALHIASAPGRGTTVTLWLPASNAGPLARRDAIVAAPPIAAPALMTRVLVVDDQANVRDVLATQLRDAGFSVTEAAGGADAIAILQTHTPFDALVTDLSMPGTDGLAVIEAAQQRSPGVPAILLTGYAGDDAALAMSGAMAGHFSLLRKPVEEVQLLNRLRALLAGRIKIS